MKEEIIHQTIFHHEHRGTFLSSKIIISGFQSFVIMTREVRGEYGSWESSLFVHTEKIS